jgi:hypothetical protein
MNNVCGNYVFFKNTVFVTEFIYALALAAPTRSLVYVVA